MKRYSWRTTADWERGQFLSVHARNPSGALSLGFPHTGYGSERFLYWLNEGQGNVLHNALGPALEATLSGSFSWEQDAVGRFYVRLSGGEINIPGSPEFEAEEFVIAGVFTFYDYPGSDLWVLGQPGVGWDRLEVCLTPAGTLRLTNQEGKDKVPLGVPVWICAFQSATTRAVARGLVLNDKLVWAGAWPPVESYLPLRVKLPNAGFRVGPGSFACHFLVFLATFDKELVFPPKGGSWESELFDLGERRRLLGIEARGLFSESLPVTLEVVLSPEKDLALGRKAKAQLTKEGSLRLPFPLQGRYGKVTLSFSGTLGYSPVVRELVLHLGKAPLALPIAEPPVAKPEDRVKVYPVPRIPEETRLVFVDKEGEAEALELLAREGDLVCEVEEARYKRRFKPAWGWHQAGYSSARHFLSPHSVSPHLMKLGEWLLPDPPSGPLLLSEDGVLLARSPHRVYAFLVSGRSLWSRWFPDPSYTPGLIVGESYYHPTTTTLWRLSVRCGALLGKCELPAPPSGPLRELEDGRLLLPLADGRLLYLSYDLEILEIVDTGEGAGVHVDIAHEDVAHADHWHEDRPGQLVPHADVYDHIDQYHRYTRYLRYQDDRWGYHADTQANEDQHEDRPLHADSPHVDTPHLDTPHGDALHGDAPHQDWTVESHTDEAGGEGAAPAGILEVEECAPPELVLQFPAYLVVIDRESGQLVTYVIGPGQPLCFAANDETGKDLSHLRLLAVGFAGGSVRLYSLETGALWSARDFAEDPVFIIPHPRGGLSFLLGLEKRLLLLSPELEVIWERELPAKVRGAPAVADHIVLPLADRLVLLDYTGEILAEAYTAGEPRGPALLVKNGTVVVPTTRGLEVFGSYDRAPFPVLRHFPDPVHTHETLVLWDESLEYGDEIASVRFILEGRILDSRRVRITKDTPGSLYVIHQVFNRLGGRGERRAVIKVLPSLVEERPVRFKIQGCLPTRVTLLAGPEVGMRIFFPEEGLDQVYQDMHVLVQFQVYGDWNPLTGGTFVVKREERAEAPVLLAKPVTIVDAEAGVGEVLLTPEDWKSLVPGTYYWGLYVRDEAGREELVGRSRFELRPALK